MITLIPAIDIMDGKCVRLSQGDYRQVKVYENDPLVVARRFEDAGISRLHLVDLDGAREGKVVNLAVLERIASSTRVVVDFGGGIKEEDDVRRVFDSGASMITLGSLAARQRDKVTEWLQRYGKEKIIIGADSKDRKIAVAGWQQLTEINVFDFVEAYLNAGAMTFLCTDISRDGMMQGASLELYRELHKKYPQAKIIASGGITHVMEIETLQLMGIDGVIIGKAYYEGQITLEDLKKFLP